MLPSLKPHRLPKWDGLDHWAGAVILGLALVLWYLITALDTTAMPGRQAHIPVAAAQAASPEYAAKFKTAEQLLKAGNLDKLKTVLDRLAADYPYQAEPFILMADYHIRRQEPLAAMHAFRQALDLNMDYLEKKRPLYQGKKIRNTTREAEGLINAALATNPSDEQMRKNREELYYMLRKLAGGCGD